jgi:predicted ATPase/DNA-binding CsgD family transcriptional regulator
VYLNRFVGRQREIAMVLRLVRDNRLVTLTGDGGCGKTRLAVEVAAREAARYLHGAWWVDLARVDRDQSIAAAAADALGLYDQPRQSRVDALTGQLRDRSMLVVFDNCEHLLDGCTGVILPVLQACPAVRVLATSREPLGVDGEVVWRVPALSTPGSGEVPPAAAAARFDSVALFADRAQAALPSFALSPANISAVARVCQQLDGIPLAIELAAAQVSAFTPEQIARAQEESVALSAGPRRSAPPRHQTLQASMDWSYDLLSPGERMVFRRLAVFPASFSAEAASEVCADDLIARDQVLPILFRLVGKSLVVVEEHALSHRYRLLQTVRQYAARRLAEAGELDQTRTCHLGQVLALVEQAGFGSPAEGQPERLELLSVERPSLRAALDWSIAQHSMDAILRLASGLGLFYATRGPASEGQQWFADALAADQSPPSALRARALWAAAFVDMTAMEGTVAQGKAIAALDMAQTVGDRRTAARTRDLLGLTFLVTSPAQARIHLQEAAALAQETGDDWCLGHALQLIAMSWTMQGVLEQARLERARSLRFVQRPDNPYFVAWHWLGVALVARQAGDLAEGAAAAARSLAAAADAGDPKCHAWAALCQADLGCLLGRATAARRAVSDLDARLQLSAASPAASARMHAARGKCDLALAKLADAEQQLRAAIEPAQEGQNLLILGECIIDLADVALLRGDTRRARHLAEDLAGCAESLGNSGLATSADVIRARAALGDGEFDAARSLCQRALAAQAEAGYRIEAVLTLEVIADISAGREMYQQAARLYGAVDAARHQLGMGRNPVDSLRRRPFRDRVALALDRQMLRELRAEGSALSLDQAIDYASRGRGARNRPQAGWESLTGTELAVARLLTDGLTNAAIAEKMLISPGTVKAHLSHIFTKTGVSNRAELAALAARHLSTPPHSERTPD